MNPTPNGDQRAVPYYEDDLVTIYNADCLDWLGWTAADVLVTDPPYGMSYISNRVKYRPMPAIVGDGDEAVRDAALREWRLGITPPDLGPTRPALMFGTWRVDRPEGVRHVITWDKGDDPGTGDLGLPWGNSTEEVYVIGEGWVGKRGPNVVRVPTLRGADRPDHPTPKPTTLMVALLSKCDPDWVIADPFMGSGATLRAAKDLGRRAIGVEIDERYCEIAAKRLSQEVLDFGGAA